MNRQPLFLVMLDVARLCYKYIRMIWMEKGIDEIVSHTT